MVPTEVRSFFVTEGVAGTTCVCWGLTSGPLQEHQELSTAESSLQPPPRAVSFLSHLGQSTCSVNQDDPIPYPGQDLTLLPLSIN